MDPNDQSSGALAREPEFPTPVPSANQVTIPPMPDLGRKDDFGKPRMSMLFQRGLRPAIVAVVRVLEYGASRYPSSDNWSKVHDGHRRYRDAALRHLAEDAAGQDLDIDSGLDVLAHAACSTLFALAFKLLAKLNPRVEREI